MSLPPDLLPDLSCAVILPRFPTAILATEIMIAAVIFFVMSLTLVVFSRYHAETKWLAYLRDPVLPSSVEQGNG